jgi:hypothetical protein
MTYALPSPAIRLTFVALAMATVLAQAGFARAATDAELWRVNPAHSKLSIGSNTLTVEHAGTRDINSKARACPQLGDSQEG